MFEASAVIVSVLTPGYIENRTLARTVVAHSSNTLDGSVPAGAVVSAVHRLEAELSRTVRSGVGKPSGRGNESASART